MVTLYNKSDSEKKNIPIPYLRHATGKALPFPATLPEALPFSLTEALPFPLPGALLSRRAAWDTFPTPARSCYPQAYVASTNPQPPATTQRASSHVSPSPLHTITTCGWRGGAGQGGGSWTAAPGWPGTPWTPVRAPPGPWSWPPPAQSPAQVLMYGVARSAPSMWNSSTQWTTPIVSVQGLAATHPPAPSMSSYTFHVTPALKSVIERLVNDPYCSLPSLTDRLVLVHMPIGRRQVPLKAVCNFSFWESVRYILGMKEKKNKRRTHARMYRQIYKHNTGRCMHIYNTHTRKEKQSHTFQKPLINLKHPVCH